jgi:ABC-type transport system involved in multi-copper enzyme maturation permease subunit
MLNLMKLEMRKFQIGSYIRAAIIANLLISVFTCLISLTITEYSSFLSIVEVLIRATFIIFSAVLLSRFVIDEFKHKTINVLFMYPISRRKLLVSKLVIIVLFTFIVVILSNLFVLGVFSIFNYFLQVIPGQFAVELLGEQTITVFMNAIEASLMCLISLYFGMRHYSTPAVLVSSFLIACIVCSNSNGFSLNTIIMIPISLVIIGVLIACLTIRKVEQMDF